MSKIFAALLVMTLHQIFPFTWQIGFWTGAGGFYVVTGCSFNQDAMDPIIYGHAASWMINAMKGIDIALKTTSLMSTMSGIGLVAISITSCASWLWWGLENQ